MIVTGWGKLAGSLVGTEVQRNLQDLLSSVGSPKILNTVVVCPGRVRGSVGREADECRVVLHFQESAHSFAAARAIRGSRVGLDQEDGNVREADYVMLNAWRAATETGEEVPYPIERKERARAAPAAPAAPAPSQPAGSGGSGGPARGRGGVGPRALDQPESGASPDEEEGEELVNVPPWRWNDPVAMQRATIETVYAKQRAEENQRSKEVRAMVLETLRLQEKAALKAQLAVGPGEPSASGGGRSSGDGGAWQCLPLPDPSRAQPSREKEKRLFLPDRSRAPPLKNSGRTSLRKVLRLSRWRTSASAGKFSEEWTR